MSVEKFSSVKSTFLKLQRDRVLAENNFIFYNNAVLTQANFFFFYNDVYKKK